MTAGEVDYYGLDELLGEEERMTRASVRSFVEREVPLLAWRLGKRKDAGTMRPEQVFLAKGARHPGSERHRQRVPRDPRHEPTKGRTTCTRSSWGATSRGWTRSGSVT